MLSSSKRKQSYTDGRYTEGQIYSVLKSSNIKIGGEIDTHFLLFCPFHYNVNTPACEIDKDSGMYICFSCGESGNIIDMVMKTTGRTYFEATRLVNSNRVEVDIEKQIDEIVDKPKDIKPFDINLVKRLNNDLMNSHRGREYFYKRNIRDEAQEKLLLGYSSKQDMVTVPIFDANDMCVGFVGRSIEGKVFKNSNGLPKKHILFNLNNSKRKDVVVVESSFDAIRLWQLGINAVATLGATISKDQIQLLSMFAKTITICPDNDDAGKRLEEKIVNNIVNKQVDVVRLPGGKDVGDHSDEELSLLFNNIGNKLILPV
jgi:DNA primase